MRLFTILTFIPLFSRCPPAFQEEPVGWLTKSEVRFAFCNNLHLFYVFLHTKETWNVVHDFISHGIVFVASASTFVLTGIGAILDGTCRLYCSMIIG